MHLMIVGIIMVQRILWKGGLKMKFEPIEIKDKNNRTIVLRNATPDDAEDLITYLKVTTAETPYLIREPEEVVMTREQETAPEFGQILNVNCNVGWKTYRKLFFQSGWKLQEIFAQM